MTNGQIKKLTTTLKNCEKTKQKIAVLRDQLRLEWEEVESILESLDQAIDDFEVGKRAMQDGIDTVSQYV